MIEHLIEHPLRRALCLTAVSALLIGLAPTTASARSLSLLHRKVQIGPLTCMKHHTHTGRGSAADPATAEAIAIRDWTSFTGAEYGAQWGSFALAANQVKTCGPNRRDWVCTVVANPCRH